MPIIRIPQPMQAYTRGQVVLNAEGRNIKHLISELELVYPGLKSALMNGDKLRPDVMVAVDGQIAPLGAMQPLTGIKEVTFLPAISGG